MEVWFPCEWNASCKGYFQQQPDVSQQKGQTLYFSTSLPDWSALVASQAEFRIAYQSPWSCPWGGLSWPMGKGTGSHSILAQGQIHTALIPPSRFSPRFPQVSHSESIQACPITGSRCTFLDYTRLKCSFVFSCLCDLFLNSMAYFHNPAVILQNLCPWNLRGMLIKRWLTCCTKIPWSKNSVFLFSMCHIFRCDLFPAAWNGQTTVTIFLHNILSAATLLFMSPLYLDL